MKNITFKDFTLGAIITWTTIGIFETWNLMDLDWRVLTTLGFITLGCVLSLWVTRK
jgi:hypothetical protein